MKTLENVTGEKKIEQVYPDPYETAATPFDLFIKEHTVQLPVSTSNQYKLLKSMLDEHYHTHKHKRLGDLESIVIMNEE